MASKLLFRISFIQQRSLYELYARHVGQPDLYGFVEVADLVFGEASQVVVDPSEERLQEEFKGVKRFLVPMHAVVRIDEVERRGTARISAAESSGNVTDFPGGHRPSSRDSGPR